MIIALQVNKEGTVLAPWCVRIMCSDCEIAVSVVLVDAISLHLLMKQPSQRLCYREIDTSCVLRNQISDSLGMRYWLCNVERYSWFLARKSSSEMKVRSESGVDYLRYFRCRTFFPILHIVFSAFLSSTELY